MIIAYHDSDIDLGYYFNKSFLYLKEIENQSNITITEIEGVNCTGSHVGITLPQFNQSNFVFVGLSHGSEDGLCLVGVDNYVSETNAMLFSNSFFYSIACSVGKELGQILINNGCKCFIGYKDESYAPVSKEFDNLFIECELHALKNFFLTTKTIQVLFDEMIQFMDSKFLELASGVDIVEAMYLNDNRERMVLLGNDEGKQLSSIDFGILPQAV